MTKREEFVQVALSQVGVKESAYNVTQYNTWYGMTPAEWCDIFVSWCAAQVGAESIIGKYAYVPFHVNFFKNRNEYTPRTNASPWAGDIIVFRDESHIGIVAGVSNGYVTTVEGNAGSTTDRVVKNHYYVGSTYIMGYCRPDWESLDSENSGHPENTVTYPMEVFDPVTTYTNGSTIEPVYADTSCTIRIGELNPYESCACLAVKRNRALVVYKVDYQENDKCGWVTWLGGIPGWEDNPTS